MQVAFHTKNFPWEHGTMVTPSRQLSVLYRPDGSSLLGTLAEAKEWWMVLFSIWWFWCSALTWSAVQAIDANYNNLFSTGTADMWQANGSTNSQTSGNMHIIRPSEEMGDALFCWCYWVRLSLLHRRVAFWLPSLISVKLMTEYAGRSCGSVWGGTVWVGSS